MFCEQALNTGSHYTIGNELTALFETVPDGTVVVLATWSNPWIHPDIMYDNILPDTGQPEQFGIDAIHFQTN